MTSQNKLNSEEVVGIVSQEGHEKYLEAFGWNSDKPETSLKYESTSRLAKAYEVALDIRKFEIELYWKRSTNFWLLITGISTALGVLAASSSLAGNNSSILTVQQKETGCLLLSMAATMLCIGWWLANKASKFWQRNWESQVDILEQKIVGPLYKTVLSSNGKFSTTTYFSVSDINKGASAYLGCIFLFLSMHFLGISSFFADRLLESKNSTYAVDPTKALALVFNILFGFYFYWSNKVKTTDHVNRLDVKLEASTRSVRLGEVRASTNGAKNLDIDQFNFSDSKTIKKTITQNVLEITDSVKNLLKRRENLKREI